MRWCLVVLVLAGCSDEWVLAVSYDTGGLEVNVTQCKARPSAARMAQCGYTEGEDIVVPEDDGDDVECESCQDIQIEIDGVAFERFGNRAVRFPDDFPGGTVHVTACGVTAAIELAPPLPKPYNVTAIPDPEGLLVAWEMAEDPDVFVASQLHGNSSSSCTVAGTDRSVVIPYRDGRFHLLTAIRSETRMTEFAETYVASRAYGARAPE